MLQSGFRLFRLLCLNNNIQIHRMITFLTPQLKLQTDRGMGMIIHSEISLLQITIVSLIRSNMQKLIKSI